MGFTPAEVKNMSLWEYSAVVEGWLKAHETGKEMTSQESDAIWAELEAYKENMVLRKH
jgi:hypothetical protein